MVKGFAAYCRSLPMSNDPQGLRLPVKLDTACNGEFVPLPLDPLSNEINRVAKRNVGTVARHLGRTRRAYLVSSSGVASVLNTMNEVFAAAGKTGGSYVLPKEAAFEDAAAESILAGDEFIFDVHLHHVNPGGRWRVTQPRWVNSLTRFAEEKGSTAADKMESLDGDTLIKEVFMDSDTTCAVLSAVPAAPENPLHVEEAAATRALVEAMTGSRLLIHGMCLPNVPGDMERMDETHSTYDVAAWKVYTQWGPDGTGYWLDDEATGIRLIEKVRSLGTRILCAHKGIPLGEMGLEHSSCRDIGVVARLYPDVKFLVYHAGYEPLTIETAYNEQQPRGINSLVKTLKEHGVAPGSNVYADLGTTWRYLMRDADQAAHGLGKLLLAVGEDNILWGTDSIWYGSPQDQIQAFRAFEISKEFQERFGYPELTPTIKRKIFGLNAASVHGLDPSTIKKKAQIDEWGMAKKEYDANRDPTFATYGPKTRKDFFKLLKAKGGIPI